VVKKRIRTTGLDYETLIPKNNLDENRVALPHYFTLIFESMYVNSAVMQ